MQTAQYQVKLPLLRVAHSSEEDCKREIERLKQSIQANDPPSGSNQISTKGVRAQHNERNPLIFDFDHNYDPQLTPRRGW